MAIFIIFLHHEIENSMYYAFIFENWKCMVEVGYLNYNLP